MTPCWLWEGTRLPQGYGRLGANGYAHRLSYETFIGPIPDGALLCHQCDEPRCVNPWHLFVGTQAENIADAARKGRLARKLTAEQVERIRNELHVPGKVFARMFGVSKTTISFIRNGKRWVYKAEAPTYPVNGDAEA